MSLSDAQNEHYRQNKDDWRLAQTFYSEGDATRYLRQGKYESDGAYEARTEQAHLFPYSRQIIHRISDKLLLRSDEVEREVGPVPSSYLDAAGPEGESHDLQMKTLGDYLLLFGEAWLQVVPKSGSAVLRVLSPITVPRSTGSRVLTLGQRTKDSTIFEKEEREQTFTVHEPGGWTTYVERNKGAVKKRVEVDSGTYSPTDDPAFFVDENGTPTPPLQRVTMPWDAVLGVEIAKTHLQMYRLENQIDGRLHTALTSGQLVYNGLDEDGEAKVIHSHKKGQNLIFLPDEADVKPMEVPTGAVEMGEKRLASKEDVLYETAYNTLQAATAESSATETVVRNQSTAAALATLATTIESAETSALRLISQAVNLLDFGGPQPQDPGVSSDWTNIDWGQSRVDLEGDSESEE